MKTAFTAEAVFPEAQITNSLLAAKVLLPDAQNGYYRGTRFDWGGAISSCSLVNRFTPKEYPLTRDRGLCDFVGSFVPRDFGARRNPRDFHGRSARQGGRGLGRPDDWRLSHGAPTEFRFRNQIVPEASIPEWKPERVSNALDQDDLYVDMTLAKVLDDKGLNATTEDFGAMFKNAKYQLWHANLAARRALKRGVPAALAGTPKYNSHANDIDFQIEADFIGLMAPGLPQAAVDISWRAGRVMNYGDGIYGGMFVSCM